jgi:glycosyltransferase involved in cell wall biosynthesis
VIYLEANVLMQKILYLITLSETGGAQKVVYQLIKGFHQNNEIYLACAPGGELIDWVCELDSKINIIPMPRLKRSISPLNDICTLFQVVHIIRKNKIDIVHCHSSKAGLLGRLAAFIAGAPIRIFTVHGWSAYGGSSNKVQAFYNVLEKIFNKFATHIVCVSEADRQYALKKHLAAGKKLCTIHNGIMPNNQEPYLRKELGISDNKIIIGTVARLCRPKNPLFTIEVYSKLLEENPNLLFIWIGDGPLMQDCHEAIDKYNLKDRFIMPGNREDAYNLIGDFNAFSLLSLWESLPISIIEAMFCGLPVIATDTGGINELVKDGKNGILIRNIEVDDIRNKIKDLISDNERLLQFGRCSKEAALSKFTEKTMIEAYRRLYSISSD